MKSPSAMRIGPIGTAIALSMVLLLGACGDKESTSPPPTPAPAASAPVPAPEPVATDEGGEAMLVQPTLVDTLSVDELLERAEEAFKEKQLFVPAGESAFEMYLRVIEQEPMQVRARNALVDMFPYAVLYVEQRTSAGDLAESERVLALMQEADENAPALPRLERGVTQLRDRVANEVQRQAAAEAQRQAAAAAAAVAAAAPQPVQQGPAPAPAPTPEPVAEAPAAVPTPAPAPTPEPVAPVAAAPVAPPPAAAALPPAAAAPAATPTVVSAVQPRYPPVALRRRVEGSVEVGFTIMPDGSVANVRVLSARPSNTFDREVINAMERWRFSPTGRQVESRRVFDFKLP